SWVADWPWRWDPAIAYFLMGLGVWTDGSFSVDRYATSSSISWSDISSLYLSGISFLLYSFSNPSAIHARGLMSFSFISSGFIIFAFFGRRQLGLDNLFDLSFFDHRIVLRECAGTGDIDQRDHRIKPHQQGPRLEAADGREGRRVQ